MPASRRPASLRAFGQASGFQANASCTEKAPSTLTVCSDSRRFPAGCGRRSAPQFVGADKQDAYQCRLWELRPDRIVPQSREHPIHATAIRFFPQTDNSGQRSPAPAARCRRCLDSAVASSDSATRGLFHIFRFGHSALTSDAAQDVPGRTVAKVVPQ